MKIKRYKKAQRILNFYQNNFNFKSPYTVLLDGTFCKAALEAKVLIKEQLPKYLGEQTKLVTTQCIIIEVEKLSKISSSVYGAWLVVKQFPVHKCGHEGHPLPASRCIKAMLKKKNVSKYIIATQDTDLREHIRNNVLAAPVTYLYSSAPTLERPTERCLAVARAASQGLSAHEASTLQSLKRKHLGESDTPPTPKKKRKVGKNPHPMSCLKSKKKKKVVPQPQNQEGKKKRKRHKKSNVSPNNAPSTSAQ